VKEKNPAELPASRPNSGAGTEKRPERWFDSTVMLSRVKKNHKIFSAAFVIRLNVCVT
jgi:hypothetical protein